MPGIAHVEERLGRWLDLRFVRLDGAEARIDLTSHVIVVGQGEVGRIVTRLLKAWGIPYLSLDSAASVHVPPPARHTNGTNDNLGFCHRATILTRQSGSLYAGFLFFTFQE